MARELDAGTCEHCHSHFGYWLTADSEIVSTLTATPVVERQSCLNGTSECPSYQTAQVNKRCVLQWNSTFSHVSAEVVSNEALPHAVRTAANRYRRKLQRRTSRRMPRAPRRAGVGRETGAASTASSSKTKGLTTTSGERFSHSRRNVALSLHRPHSRNFRIPRAA